MKKIMKILAIGMAVLLSIVILAPASTADPFESDGDDDPDDEGHTIVIIDHFIVGGNCNDHNYHPMTP